MGGHPTPMVTINMPGSIAAVVRDEQNRPHAVPYASLAPDEQQQVLQRLLLQSAMHKQLLEEADRAVGQGQGQGQGQGLPGESLASLVGSRPPSQDKLLDLSMGNAIAVSSTLGLDSRRWTEMPRWPNLT